MALDGVGDEGHTPATLTQRKRPGTYCTEDWKSLMAGLDEYGETTTTTTTGIRTPKC